MTERARFMARQITSISMHRSLDGRRILNDIQWQRRELLQSAHRSPEFSKEWTISMTQQTNIDPHLHEVVHVAERKAKP
jgi:hypothetical protein